MSSTAPSAGVVETERPDDGVLLITLNRPDARNAVNADVSRALAAALDLLDVDPDLRVGILTGRGPAFCAGQDLKAIAAGEPPVVPELADDGWAGFVRRSPRTPLIAAVNGFAYGGGMELALACDIVLASETAAFALPEVTRGLVAAAGGVPRILQQLPPKIGMRLLLTGQSMSAAEASRWGFVNEVVAPEDLLDAARALARTIAANAPLSVQATKRIAVQTAHLSTWDAATWSLVEREYAPVFASDDAREGAAAFAEKRVPVWRGR